MKNYTARARPHLASNARCDITDFHGQGCHILGPKRVGLPPNRINLFFYSLQQILIQWAKMYWNLILNVTDFTRLVSVWSDPVGPKSATPVPDLEITTLISTDLLRLVCWTNQGDISTLHLLAVTLLSLLSPSCHYCHLVVTTTVTLLSLLSPCCHYCHLGVTAVTLL